MSEWISVKDKLPPLDKVVMVCFPNGYNGSLLLAWGARMDDGDGWLWGVQTGSNWIDPEDDAFKNDIQADDDYPVQFWQEIPALPALTPESRS